MLDYKYAYLLGSLLLLFPVWLLFYFHRKDLRKELLLISFGGGVAGVISEFWYLQDYWHPSTVTGTPVGIEDFIFGFLIVGICGVIYEECFGERYVRKDNINPLTLMLPVVLLSLAFISLLSIFFNGFRINSIYATFLSFILVSTFLMIKRRDLIKDSVLSGLLCGVIITILYYPLLWVYPEIFDKFWKLENLSGYFIGKVPIEEIMWFFGLGLMVGPVYEFLMGYRFRKDKRLTRK